MWCVDVGTVVMLNGDDVAMLFVFDQTPKEHVCGTCNGNLPAHEASVCC